MDNIMTEMQQQQQQQQQQHQRPPLRSNPVRQQSLQAPENENDDKGPML
jgi:hypothetical protein